MPTSKREAAHPQHHTTVQSVPAQEHRRVQNASVSETAEDQIMVDAKDVTIAMAAANAMIVLIAEIDLSVVTDLNAATVPNVVNAVSAVKVVSKAAPLVASRDLSAIQIVDSAKAGTSVAAKEPAVLIHVAEEDQQENQARKGTRGINLSLNWQ
jgi:hypothetical protein